jgi:enolase
MLVAGCILAVMSTIEAVLAQEIIDSRGTPTLEATVVLSSGAAGRAAVPSGASTGTHEAVELRDGDMERFGGRGVRKAVQHVEGLIADALYGVEADVRGVDAILLELDGTPNKSKLGANATLAVSLAVARAAADDAGVPLYQFLGGVEGRTLPVPLMNVINGGAHADNAVDIQEFMIAPHGFETFSDALRAGTEVYWALKKIVKSHGYTTNVGDEGGFAPALKSNGEAVALIVEGIVAAGFKPGEQIAIALDCAASEFSTDGGYRFEGQAETLPSSALMTFYAGLCERYPIFSIEDPLAEDDWDAWTKFTAAHGQQLQIVGDDLLVTNPTRLRQAIQTKACNSILVKLNQIGTLSETLNCIYQGRRAGFTPIISHRSGETEDTTIAHLAVAINAGQIKTGAPCRTDRVAKYNELLRIERSLGRSARFAGEHIPALQRFR